jgi:O-antigen ligase
MSGYVAATIVLLYIGNLTEQQLSRNRLVRQLGFFFVMVVIGGIVGTFFATFEFTSPLELLLPNSVAQNAFVRSLVHPSAAQLQEVLGYTAPRPSAPFGYTNTWGNCLSLLLGWFVIGWLVRTSGRRRLAGILILILAAIPVVYSLNRGLWIALGLCAVYAAVRMAMHGRLVAVALMFTALAVSIVAFLASPLTGVVQARLDNPKSNNIREFTTEATLEAAAVSPVLGFGSTRAATGSSQSIAVGKTADCQRCGNPTIGSNGQLWLLLIAQGFVGAALYVAFYVRSAWQYRRDRTPIGAAGWLVCVLPLFYMFIYNALVIPLLISLISIALLWRNDQLRAAEPNPVPAT